MIRAVAGVRPAWPLSIGLALTVFSGHWRDMGVPVTLDRLLIAIGILLAVVGARRRDPYALRSRPVDWLLAVVALYAVVSAILVGTVDDHAARFALLDRLSLIGFVVFFVAPLAYAEPEDREILLGVLVVMGGYLGVIALLETTGPKALVIPHYITDPAIRIHIDRARGPVTDGAANGFEMLVGAVAGGIAMATWTGRRRRVLAAVVIALCGLGILLTVTRAAWIAGVLGALLALLLVREARRFAIPVIVGSFVGVLLAFAAIPGLQHRAQRRADDQAPIWDRQNSNAAALRMIRAHPVVGVGWGAFPTTSRPFYRQSPDHPLTFVHDLHSLYLTNAVELGLLGTLLWGAAVLVVLLGAIFRRGPPELRLWKLGLVSVAIGYAVIATSTPAAYAAPTLIVWAWAGIAWGPRTQVSEARDQAAARGAVGRALPA